MTIKSLFNVATVKRGDGKWTHGYEVDALSCGRLMSTADICNVEPQTPTNEPAGTGFKIVPFAQIGEQEFNVRCAPADAESALVKTMDQAAEYFVAGNFWRGDVPNWRGADEGVYLAHAEVQTVAAEATVTASIVAALAQAYENHPELISGALVHLGLSASYSLPVGFDAAHANVTFVESAGYPLDGIAVTGAVGVRLGTIESHTTIDQTINRQYISGARLAAVEFDPCLAVVVA